MQLGNSGQLALVDIAVMSDALNVYLGNLKPQWIAYCERNGLSPGQVMKEAVERQLAQESADTSKDAAAKVEQVQPAEHREPEHKKRFELLLTTSEREALAAHAEAENCSMRQWVLDGLRARLTQQPQFSTAEIKELGQSNYQLRQIGRNLNQIAKKLNRDEEQAVSVELIGDVKKQIDIHTQRVTSSIRASIERWPLA